MFLHILIISNDLNVKFDKRIGFVYQYIYAVKNFKTCTFIYIDPNW